MDTPRAITPKPHAARQPLQKIMKTTFKSSEIAHIWAHKSAPEGKCPSSMRFDGDAFYSYSTEIARHITHKGKDAILLNTSSYSVTTLGHQNDVHRAIHGFALPIFAVGLHGTDTLRYIGGKEIYDYAIEKAARCQKKATTARQRKDSYLAESSAWLEKAKAANEFFGLRRKVHESAIARLADAKARAEKKAAKERTARELREREEQAAGYAAWLKGEPAEYFNSRVFPVAFRVESEELVSTLGARVPLDAAKVAFCFALRHRGQSWHRNGDTCPVGHYQLDAINEHGIVAGCHRIPWEEVERLAPVLG